MNIQPGGLHPAAPRLTYVGLMVQFNRLDRTQPFDVYETRLYVVLLGFLQRPGPELDPANGAVR